MAEKVDGFGVRLSVDQWSSVLESLDGRLRELRRFLEYATVDEAYYDYGEIIKQIAIAEDTKISIKRAGSIGGGNV